MHLSRPTLFAIPFSIFALGAAAPAGTSAAPCAVADLYVKAHLKSLPTSLADFRKFDFEHRKAIFDALGSEVKIRMWRQQFDEFRSRDGFTATQDAYVDEYLRFAKVVYATNAPVARGSHTDTLLHALTLRGVELFGAEKAREYLHILRTGLTKSAAPAGILGFFKEQSCNCESAGTDPDECDANVGNFCNQFSWCGVKAGCGEMDNYICDGFCTHWSE